MTAARARNVFIAALLISLLLHLILAGYLRWPFVQQEHEQIARVRITQIRHIPVQTPQPTPAPTVFVTPRVRASIVPPVLTSRAKSVAPPVRTSGAAAHPAIRTTPAPAPSTRASAQAAAPCGGHANADPAVAATPDVAEIPQQARASKVSGTAIVRVALDGAGHVTAATLAQSSGNSGLDAVAATMARNAIYTPKYVQCKPVPGEYAFSVQFSAW